MQTDNTKFLIAATAGRKEPFAKAVASSTEVGVVFPSKLRAELTSAGFTIVDDDKAMADYGFSSMKVLKRVIVNDKDGTMVAMGAALDKDEAILAAALGWVRENPAAGVTATEGIAVAPNPAG